MHTALRLHYIKIAINEHHKSYFKTMRFFSAMARYIWYIWWHYLYYHVFFLFHFCYHFIIFFCVIWVDPDLSFKTYVCGCRSVVKLCPWVCSAICLCSWWRHQMEIFSASLAICAGNLPVPDDFPAQRSVTRSFDVFFDLRLNKWLSKQSWG